MASLKTSACRAADARRARLPRWAAALGLAALCAAPGGAGAEEPRGEYEVKAAFLFNFVKFVEWPDAALGAPGSPLVIGVLGGEPFGAALREGRQQVRLGERPIEVRRLEPGADVSGCHVLFVTAGERESEPAVLEAVAGASVLTVGETRGFVGQGGIIGFYEEQRRVRFEIDPAAARRARLRISSRLLRLARIAGGDS